jgi:hypothetical protein
MTFKEARKRIPRCVEGNYDSLTHTTIEDLAFCTQHELDLYYEGEDNEIKNERNAVIAKRYFKLLMGEDYK